jgi:hypothetical protein
MPGRQQEGRRAAVRLHADQEQPRLRLRQLEGAVRAHRAAGMLVRVDQRRQGLRAVERRIEVGAQLRQEAGVRLQAGRHDHRIHA